MIEADMLSTSEILGSLGLPPGDLHALPTSEKRFPDGAQYRVEIPSTEGPRCLETVIAEAERLDVVVHRVSQGSGVFLHTDAELDEMAHLGAAANVEISLFARPNAGWGVSAATRAQNAPDVYPAGTHLEATTVALSRERVRRARLGMELLEQSGYEATTSELGAEGLAVPVVF